MNNKINKFFETNPNVQKMFDEWVKENYPNNNQNTNTMYKWVCHSDNGSFKEDSEKDYNKVFDNQEDCYDDMRDHAIHKIFWNTEWFDVCEDVELDESDPNLIKTKGFLKPNGDIGDEENWGIGYRMEFHPHKIQHHSYSGLYTYEIIKVNKIDE